MNNEEYIAKHRTDDVRALALKKAPEGIDAPWCLQQIEGWQLSQKKLPKWSACHDLWFPPRISMEQCSSEATAMYKRGVVERLVDEADRGIFADFTGGFGIDFSYMAVAFRRAVYVEQQSHLCDIARHNFPLLGLQHALVVNQQAPVLLKQVLGEGDCPRSQTVLYLDPARRDDVGRKVVALEDCTPNVIGLQDVLAEQARFVILKLSPMLDITQAVRQLRKVVEVHVVSVQGECKEVLLVVDNDAPGSSSTSSTPMSATVTYHCADIRSNPENGVLTDTFVVERHDDRPSLSVWSGSDEATYLYEPNASILKAGVQDYLCGRFSVAKLHPMSNLFVGNSVVDGFPGRAFVIEHIGDFSKSGIKDTLMGMSKANLTVRNFPATVAELRKKLKLKEGGDSYLFATTLSDGKHVLIRTIKA